MRSNWWFVLAVIIFLIGLITAVENGLKMNNRNENAYKEFIAAHHPDSSWVAPSLFTDFALKGRERAMVIYGRDLIIHTARYFGKNGIISSSTNGMNCQNCHLDAGARPWGNNFGAVSSTYPRFNNRSNTVLDIYGRVNDCFERSLNGTAIKINSYEMQSIYFYLKWLGKNVQKGIKPTGSGLSKINLMDRAADPEKGKIIYLNNCQTCHGADGQGIINQITREFIYPPLWGINSYNDGAGMYRVSMLAGFLKYNMPFNLTSRNEPKLSDEEAWDVAAFVNSRPRPHLNQSYDWPDINKKIFDVPFGPYPDKFSEYQHKYGPYQPLLNNNKEKSNPVNKF